MIKDGFYLSCGICFLALAIFFAYLGLSLPLTNQFSGPAFLALVVCTFASALVAIDCFLSGLDH